MAGEIYLFPENVREADARMVLDFLNGAASAEEIATAVEIPNELDIGLRVAARLLAARDNLGGFSSLEQVYAVPYIGPERFTELIVSLSSARPPVPEHGLDESLLERFNQRLTQLEEHVGGGSSVRLSAINPDALLGEDTLLLAELRDAQGRALVDQSLTLVTTWGMLRGRAGSREQQGNSVTVRSDHLGLCKVRLSAALGEALTPVESASLNRALSELGSLSENPRDSERQLRQLAQEYRSPGNDSLRRAIDVYFQGYGSDTEVPTDSLSSWPRISVTVIAWLTPSGGQATHQIPVTLINVQQRNWFYAWLWTYRQLLEGTGLIDSLASVIGDDRSGGGILSDIYSRVGGFVKAQPGLVGRQLGQTFAAQSLNTFLQTGLDRFPQQERTKVVTGITSGVNSLIATRPFATLESSRTDLKLEIDASVAEVKSGDEFASLDARITSVEKSALTQDDLSQFEVNLMSQVTQTMDSKIEASQAGIQSSLDSKVDAAQLNQLSQQVSSLNSETQNLKRNVATLDTRVTGVNRRVDDLDRGGVTRR